MLIHASAIEFRPPDGGTRTVRPIRPEDRVAVDREECNLPVQAGNEARVHIAPVELCPPDRRAAGRRKVDVVTFDGDPRTRSADEIVVHVAAIELRPPDRAGGSK